MKDSLDKNEILASSSGLIASVLNLFPGLGTGYIYQRRWRPYFLTGGAITIWVALGILLQGENETSQKEQLIGLAGLLLISIVTAFESYLAFKRSLKIVEQKRLQEQNIPAKKGWFKN